MPDEIQTPFIDSVKKYSQISASFLLTKIGLLLVRHPIYIVQVKKQAYPNCSSFQITQDILQNHGIRGFYKSTTTSALKILVGECYRGPLMIGVPQLFDRSLPKKLLGDSHSLCVSLMATSTISLIDSAIICPILRMSTEQLTYENNISLKEIVNKYQKINLVKQLYRGFTPLFIQTTSLWGSFFIVDDISKNLITKHFGQITYFSLALSSIAGGISQSVINIIPDTIRVQMQKTNHLSQNFRQTTKNLIKTNGTKALFASLPHKFTGNIIAFGYKSFLRHYWLSKNSPKENQSEKENVSNKRHTNPSHLAK